jgi:hypothetical protein
VDKMLIGFLPDYRVVSKAIPPARTCIWSGRDRRDRRDRRDIKRHKEEGRGKREEPVLPPTYGRESAFHPVVVDCSILLAKQTVIYSAQYGIKGVHKN